MSKNSRGDKVMARSKYESHVCGRLYEISKWARDGCIDDEIAKRLGVALSTFYVYKKRYSEFSESLKKGKEIADYEVEDALFKRASGYEYEEVVYKRMELTEKEFKQECARLLKANDGLGEGEKLDPEDVLVNAPTSKMIEVKRMKKQMPTDTIANIFWLNNRQSQKWSDRKEVNHSGGMDINTPL